MKPYKIVYGNLIDTKTLSKLDPKILQLIKKQIEDKLTTKPEIFGKPLRTSLKGYRRLRVGAFRVIFKIQGRSVKIVFIGKKPDVYTHFESKIR